MQGVHERAKVRPLLYGVCQRHRRSEQRTGLGRLDLEVRMDHDRCQSARYRQGDNVGRVRAADQDKASADARSDVVGV